MQDSKYYSAPPGSDLTNYQYCAAKLDSSGNIIPATAATDDIIGIIEQNPSLTGGNANVRLINSGGIMYGLAGGSISRGNKLTCNSSGQLIATTTNNNTLVGEAIDTGVVSGQVFRFLIYKANYPMN